MYTKRVYRNNKKYNIFVLICKKMEAIAELSDDQYPAFFGEFFDLDNYVNNEPESQLIK